MEAFQRMTGRQGEGRCRREGDLSMRSASATKVGQTGFCFLLFFLIQRKQRHHFAGKGLYSQSYGFFSSHEWMGELDHKEG